MNACVDVHYPDEGAIAACVLFSDWQAESADREFVATFGRVAPYEAGRFYLRELPCIRAVLGQCPAQPSTVVIDGFVWLGGRAEPGLGAHLYGALREEVAVIGVAKNEFKGAYPVQPVYRGVSAKPLYVSAVGICLEEAANKVRAMAGEHRIPSLLRRVDSLSRNPSLRRSEPLDLSI